jgi:hypothetical protein
MATYKEIYGTNVEVLGSDPSNPVEGQIWYNSTSQTLKGYALVAGSWATAGPLNTSRSTFSGSGTQTAGLVFGGITTVSIGETESYNGTSWTELNNLNTARDGAASAGATNTAALAIGGETTTPATTVTNVENWNGTSWTEVGDITIANRYAAGAGTNTAALEFGGGPGIVADTESWNGSTWTELNNLNNATSQNGGCGATNTAALNFSGSGPGGPTAQTESWNGTSWTIVNSVNTARRGLMGNRVGSQTLALCVGGTNPPVVFANTESWNGTAWTEVNDLNIARGSLAAIGNSTAALAAGGSPSGSATEEWSGPAVQTVNITVS